MHIPRIIYQQSPPLFFHVHPVHPCPKGFCHAMVSRPARIKTGTIERPAVVFCIGLLHTQCPHRARKRISLSPSLSLFADVARNRPNLRVPSVFHPTFFFPSFFLSFFFFQINFKPSTEG